MIKHLILLLALFSLLFNSLYAQTCEPNMDFELGTFSNWSYFKGTCCDPGGAIVANTAITGTPPVYNFSVTSGSALDSCCSFPVVGEGIHSLKIGTRGGPGDNRARKAVYYIHVPSTPSNYALVYRYAFVLEIAGHTGSQDPRMTIRASDSATGATIIHGDQTFTPLTPGTYSGTIPPPGVGAVACKAWTTQLLNLSGYGGQTIKLEVATSQCGPTGHFGYGYFDMSCGLFAISTTTNCATVTLSAPAGFTSYAWYDSATFTTFYGPTASVSVPVPGTVQHYAVIITPAPGFGVPDTLYTTVVPGGCSGAPVAGTVSSTAANACATSPFTVSSTGYTPGIDYQWQSSPDSLVWTNIVGATNTYYTSPGIAASTYFRIKDSCCASGLAGFSAGLKVTFVACCSGVPAAGSATASTTSCSACSLTLNLTGFTPLPGFIYQWQQSPDSITWTDMFGANNVPYTFSPLGSYFYRCKVTCSHTGLTGPSAGVKVLYQYVILDDSAAVLTGGCPGTGPEFYAKVNGTSPLLRLKTFYGDGTYDSTALTAATGYSYSTKFHSYAVSGTYSIKNILYWNNIPQDSSTYNYTYLRCSMLHIGAYLDGNGNCILDAGEPGNGAPLQIRIDSAGIPIDTISMTGGLYYPVYGPIGTIYSFRMLTTTFTTCPVSGIINETITGATFYPIRYFALNCPTTNFDIYEHCTYNCAGQTTQRGVLNVGNYLCQLTPSVVRVTFSPKYTYNFAVPAPTSIVGNTATWNFSLSGASGPATQTIVYWLNSAAGIIPLGDTAHTEYAVTPLSGDINTTNNQELILDTVTAPWDPNHIIVTPPGCFDTDTTLQYTIHFENLGNDTAHNVHLMDTLSSNLDMGSLKLVMASANMNISTYIDGPYNIAKFDFPGINLLDSSKHGLNNGAVIYTIKTKPGLITGSTIPNRAGIYFDYNEVVMTNTVENIKGCPVVSVATAATDKNIYLYPNPASTELTIKTGAGAYTSFTITNNVGQVLLQDVLNGTITKISIKSLPAGIYYVTLKGDNNSVTKKFVKM